jgi:iron complex outermembrane recepter protein
VGTLRRLTALPLACLCLYCAQPATAQDLADADLETLMKVNVTSVSKKEQQLFGAASAIYVITSEDIRRSGVTSVPELLRSVPGLYVAKMTGARWIVASRGLGELYGNKVQVLVDGISVYDDAFGGAWWGAFEPPVDDIERIEVIRGPGATVWGANAVNGIINIITKEPRLSQDSLLTMTAGTVDGVNGTVRHGGTIGGSGYYRMSLSGLADGRMDSEAGRPLERRFGLANLRVDLSPNASDSVQAQVSTAVGERYDAGEMVIAPVPPFTRPYAEFNPQSFAAFQIRWARLPSIRRGWSVKGFTTLSSAVDQGTQSRSRVSGGEFQQHVGIGVHDFTWNLEYRHSLSEVPPSWRVVHRPARHAGHQISALFQDEISLIPQRLVLTLGSRVEDTELTEVNVEPGARMSWQAKPNVSVWGAVSRATRTPARYLLHAVIKPAVRELDGGLIGIVQLVGQPNLGSEHLVALESGARLRVSEAVTVDTAVFRNHYGDLIDRISLPPVLALTPVPHIVLGATWVNTANVTTYGMETTVRWRASSWWTIDAALSAIEDDLSASSTGGVGIGLGAPNRQWNIGSRLSPRTGWEVDARLFGVGSVRGNVRLGIPDVPDYRRLDARIGRRLSGGLDISVAGQNLLRGRHLEAQKFASVPVSVPRSINARVAWSF